MKPGPKFTEKHPKLAKFLEEKAPHMLNAVKDKLPNGGLLGFIKNLIPSDPRIKEEDKAVLMKELSDVMLEFYKADTEDYKIEVDDRKDARKRDAEIVKSTGKRDPLLLILSIFGVAAPCSILVFLLVHGLPTMSPEVSMLIGGLIGIIFGEYKTVFSFFFGSSRGSKEKNAMVEKIVDKM